MLPWVKILGIGHGVRLIWRGAVAAWVEFQVSPGFGMFGKYLMVDGEQVPVSACFKKSRGSLPTVVGDKLHG